MKKYIVSILFIGLIAMILMSFQSSASGSNSSGSSSLSIIKGNVFYGHHHRVEGVTFGIRGFKPNENEVTSVKVFDTAGNLVGEVIEFEQHYSHGAFWFEVEFDHLRVPAEFTIEVHVRIGSGSGTITISTLSAKATVPPPTPTDPDETVLIVRYP